MKRIFVLSLFLLFVISNLALYFLSSLEDFVNILFLEGLISALLGFWASSGISEMRLLDSSWTNPWKTRDILLDRREETRRSQLRVGVPLLLFGFMLIVLSIIVYYSLS